MGLCDSRENSGAFLKRQTFLLKAAPQNEFTPSYAHHPQSNPAGMDGTKKRGSSATDLYVGGQGVVNFDEDWNPKRMKLLDCGCVFRKSSKRTFAQGVPTCIVAFASDQSMEM